MFVLNAANVDTSKSSVAVRKMGSSLGPRHLATIHRPINKKLPIIDNVKVPIDFQENIFSHDFLVVNKLITSVILGIDFLQKHKPTLILVTVLL